LKQIAIDINADLGEGNHHDAAIMPMLSSCNIACGGHFGTTSTMQTAIRFAKKHGVLIGAHPSFPDTAHFGRKRMDMSHKNLQASIVQQIKDFEAVCISENAQINHIKLHGALYNLAAEDVVIAKVVLDAIVQTKVQAIIYVPPNSAIALEAKNSFTLRYEAFVDRRYNNDLSLVSRTCENAIIESPALALEQIKQMVIHKKVHSITGDWQHIDAQTFCIHSDHENSVAILKYIRQEMSHHGIVLNS
jgi:UPF0271 protein